MRRPRRGGEVHHPVRAQPAPDVDRQADQQPGQPGQVIAGVQHDDDVRVALAPAPGRGQARYHLADLRGGDLGGVVGRAGPSRTASSGSASHDVRPGSSATTQE